MRLYVLTLVDATGEVSVCLFRHLEKAALEYAKACSIEASSGTKGRVSLTTEEVNEERAGE